MFYHITKFIKLQSWTLHRCTLNIEFCTNDLTMNSISPSHKKVLKGGHLGFFTSHQIKNICSTEIYTKKLYKSSIIKNHKITKKTTVFDGGPLKGYVASLLIFRFCTRNKIKVLSAL